MTCKLALEDGTVFTGESFGASGTQTGEVVFNTGLSGYQEVFTDPSYCGQIVTMTFPQIGNVGTNLDDFEAHEIALSGVVVKELPHRPSNYRNQAALSNFLIERGIIGLAGVDTRAITRRTRIHGALRGAISTEITSDLELVTIARDAPPMSGANLVTRVTPKSQTAWPQPLWQFEDAASPPKPPRCHVVSIDCGIKHNILRHLVQQGARVTVVPANTPAGQIRELQPDGLLVGNGPGDPAAVSDTIETLQTLIGSIPIFGICLGHQMLAIAIGADSYKLPFGHHGINVPVLNLPGGRAEITSQNHGFAIDTESLEHVGGMITHVNLNDQSLEGFVHPDKNIMAVQFHPEASPGPHDASYLFERFVDAVVDARALDGNILV